MLTILIIEDDRLLNDGISFSLINDNYRVISAYTYNEGIRAFKNNSVDIALIDINLPQKSGLELCREIRGSSDIPIIFVTANDTDNDIVKGYKTGCDDYITKPFSIEVLKQHIKAILKRTITEKNVFRHDNIIVNYDKMQLIKGSEPVKLTATEYKLIELLTKHRGQILSRQIILEKLWDIDGNFVDENTLSVNIRRLRQKLEADPKNPTYIVTIFGIGYTWGEKI